MAESDWAKYTPYGPQRAVTIASAATIAPVGFLTILTGNVAITAITVPPDLVGVAHLLAIQFAGTAGITGGNNITATKASVASEIMLLVYNPVTAKYVAAG